ncbi:LysR family transcriptional regulator [Herbaspirillum lusitanum]|jgi:DNA-binding transcriptional LysR family regulator|uniref:LysR family transcriptional regulator n=1 Tax=Herbaspirillum lusitanum TaxID=213312 RepID=A0ABW9A9A5_9BURK
MLNRLEMMRIFCAAAEAGNFKEAAVRLGISPQAVTRAVQELEHLQGELLFHRNTRQVQITAYGETLAARGREGVRMLDDLFERESRPADSEMSGLVRLTAPSALGRKIIVPALAEIAGRYPKLNFDLRFSDQLSDVVNDKIDIGVRVGFLHDNRFVVRKLGKVRFHVLATPRFIRQYGRPQNIEQLQDFPLSALVDRSTGRFWHWMFKDGQQIVPSAPRFICDDSGAEIDLVRSGQVLGQIASFLADQAMSAGKLVPLLEDVEPEPWDMYIYRPQRGPLPARLRMVYDHLVQTLSAD